MAGLLKLPEVAQRLEVSEKTARRYVKAGVLPSVFVGNAYRVNEEDIEDYLRRAKVEVGSNPPKTAAPSPEILKVGDWERRRPTIMGLTIVATALRKRWAKELQQGGLAEHRAMEIIFAIKGVLENAESQTILGGLDHTDKADAKQVKRLREELERLVGLHKLAVDQSITGFKFESIVDGVVLEQVSASPLETAKESHA